MGDPHIFLNGWSPNRKTYDHRVRSFVLKRRNQQKEPIKSVDYSPTDRNECPCEMPDQLPLTVVTTAPTSLEQATMDPFNSFSRPLSKHEMNLIRHYVEGPYVWEGSVKQTSGWRPSPKIFLPVNLSSPMTIDVMIAYGAKTLAELYPHQRETRIELHRRRVQCFAALRQVSIPEYECTVQQFIAVGGVICMLIETPGSMDISPMREELTCHLKAFRVLIERAGGVDAVSETFFEASWLIHWIMSFGFVYDIISSELSSCFMSQLPQGDISPRVADRSNPSSVLEELADFYIEAYNIARQCLSRSSQGQKLNGDDADGCDAKMVMSLFCQNTTPWKVLKYEQRAPIHRIVPLMYINVLHLYSWSLPRSSQEDLHHLYQYNLAAVDTETTLSTAPLVWALFTNIECKGFNHYFILRRVFRLLTAFKKLSPDIASRMTDALLCFISIPAETDDLQASDRPVLEALFAKSPLPEKFSEYIRALQMILES